MTETTPAVTEANEPRPHTLPGYIAWGRAKLSKRKELKRFIKFAVVGGIGFVIDFGTTNLLWSLLPASLEIGLPFGLILSYIGIAGAIGFLAAIISNFLWNRYWTYPDSRSKSIFGQFAMFLAINLLGILIRIPILEFASVPFGNMIGNTVPALDADLALRLGKNAALMIAVVVVMFWNFFVNRYITYNDVD